MTLRIALVIDGEHEGAKRALSVTAQGIDRLGDAANRTAKPVDDVAEGLGRTAEEGNRAAPEIEKVGNSAVAAEPKLVNFKNVLLGTIAGIAGGFAAGGVAAAIRLATDAVGAFAAEVLSSESQINRALESHETLVKRIKGAYAEAEGAASSYGNNTIALLTFEAERNITMQRQTLERLQSELISGGLGSQLLTALNPFGDPTASPLLQAGGTPFAESVRTFLADLGEGSADAVAFRNEIAAIANTLPFGDEGRGLAERLLGNTDELANVQAQLLAAIDLYDGATGNIEAMATAIGGSVDDIAGQRAALETSIPVFDEYINRLIDISERSATAFGAASPVARTRPW